MFIIAIGCGVFWEKYPSTSKLKNTTVEELGEMLYKRGSGFFDAVKAKQILELAENDSDTATQKTSGTSSKTAG